MQSRRRFLRTLATTAGACTLAPLCASGCGPQLATGQSPARGPVPAGNLKDVPLGTFAFVGDQPVVLARDDGGLYAMSAICSHQACSMRNDGGIDASGLHCDCHGSTFDKSGTPTSGPARRTLDHYAVELGSDGAITVQASQLVSTSTRTFVP